MASASGNNRRQGRSGLRYSAAFSLSLPLRKGVTGNGMLRLVLTRLSLVVPTFVGITLLVFVLIRLIPGDPIETMAGERGIDPARLAQLRKDYGFDQPVLVQYGLYLSRLGHGDLGRSIVNHEPGISRVPALFPATIELSACAIPFA